MAMLVAGVLSFLCYSASCNPFKGDGNGSNGYPALDWQEFGRVTVKEQSPALSPRVYHRPQPDAGPLPDYLRVPASADNKALLAPELNIRPLPYAVRKILLASPSPPTYASPGPALVESTCFLDRMYVRVSKQLFKSKTASNHLKLGSCAVNQATAEHYYFLYLLEHPCGFSVQSLPDAVVYTITLQFSPPGPVIWELPFEVPIQCNLHRIHHVYSAGIHPKLMGGTVFKRLNSKASATIVPTDDAGNVLIATQTYDLGDTIFFVATFAQPQTEGRRLYVNECYMTTSQDSTSMPKYPVIENRGCMVAGIITEQAKFLVSTSPLSLRFSLSALVFKEMLASHEMTKLIYLHCEISAGPLTATAGMKSCNYETATKRWRELYDDHGVCSCCNTSCVSSTRAPKLMHTTSSLVVTVPETQPENV